MSNAFAPRGTLFQHSPDGITYTTVAEVTKIQSSGSKADLADVTNMDSSSSFREFLATLVDSGEISLDTNFIPGNATQQILETDFNNQTLGYYKIVLPNSLGNATFRAYVSSKDFDLPVDKQGTKAIKLKVTGAITATW
jgi:predicted secreted protein